MRLIVCATDRWEVGGGSQRAICVAERRERPEPADGVGRRRLSRPVPAHGRRLAGPLRLLDAPALEPERERAVRPLEHHRHDPHGQRRRVGAVEGRRRLLPARISGPRVAPLDSGDHGQDRGSSPAFGTHGRGPHRGAPQASRGPARRLPQGRRPQAAREGQAHGARARRAARGPGLVPGDRPLRRAPLPRLRDRTQPPRRRRRHHRLRHGGRPQGVRRVAGLHGVRRLAGRGPRAEDLQGPGPGDVDRRAVHPDQRLGRRADPGGRREPRRLRLHVRTQRARLGRDPADQRDHGPVRRRRRLLPRDHRLHLHGPRDLAHVHHRSRRDQGGDRRGGHVRGARRRDDAREPFGGRVVREPGRGGVPRDGALPAVVPPVEQPGGRRRRSRRWTTPIAATRG